MKRLSNIEAFDKLVGADCYIKTVNQQDKNKVNKARSGTNPTTPASDIGKVAAELGLRAHADEVDTQPDPPPIDPPPVVKRYAPRSYNLASNDSDPRFCCLPEYGVVDKGDHYEDEMGCYYDKEHMFSSGGPGGYRDRTFRVAGLNESNNMNGKEPCEPYVSDSGLSVGGSAGYPGDPATQTGSYHK